MLILSRHRVHVATLLSQYLSHKPLFGCDMSLEELMSQQLDLVATFFLVHLMSRQLIDVATSTLCSGCHDSLILSLPLFLAPVVATAL